MGRAPELRAKGAKREAWGVLGCGVTAASSVELWAAEEGAELGTFHPRAQETHPSPQSSRGQRKAITSLVFVAAQHVGGEGMPSQQEEAWLGALAERSQ